MAVQRSNSLMFRAKQAPVLKPFRDDTELIGLRYEQTKQAEPPIPVPATSPLDPPPRDPRRGFRPGSLTSSDGSSVRLTPQSLAPPHDQHPLFRRHLRRISSAEDGWSRTSGAPTASSMTLQGDEEDFAYQKFVEKATAPSLFSRDDEVFNVAPLRIRPSATDQLPSCFHQVPSTAAPTLSITCLEPTDSPLCSSQAKGEPVAPTPSTTCLGRADAPSPFCPSPDKGEPVMSRGWASAPTKRLQKRTYSDAQLVSTASSVKPSRWGSLKAAKSPKLHAAPLTTGAQEPPPHAPMAPKLSVFSSRGSITSSIQSDAVFMPITTDIPTDSLLADEDLFEQLEFSNRGSIMFGAKRFLPGSSSQSSSSSPKPSGDTSHPSTDRDSHGATSNESRAVTENSSAMPPAFPSIRVLPAEVERESQKVRSLYDTTDSVDWRDGGRASTLVERSSAAVDAPSKGEEKAPYDFLTSDPSHDSSPSTNMMDRPRYPKHSSLPSLSEGEPPTSSQTSGMRLSASSSQLHDSRSRKEHELAGGLEDWEDVNSADVDRFGFIKERKVEFRPTSPEAPSLSDDRHLSPNRRRNFFGRRPTSSYTSPVSRTSIKKVIARSLNTQNTESSHISRRSARAVVRQASNRLPHNRSRRWVDEAQNMLDLAPGQPDIHEEALSGKAVAARKRKEVERTEKWRKMAKVVKKGKEGEGMDFEFDVKNQKLIDRTWKGIPESWRATAWFSFLATSARNMGSEETVERLFADYRHLQDVSSPDDGQINLDVPRTVNSHIMFRAKYRGGQRLLFRVLHAMSLYFPDTGYVQGMGSLAATLLVYYDEEMCFVMMVRMWRYRGLERLYQPGFAGLFAALEEFKDNWLGRKEVGKKLASFDIDPTAYGTRWYLTLFNLSLPFSAQLRVWDVFMLLGDCTPEPSAPASAEPSKGQSGPVRGLDILHATSAALIDAWNEVLLDSDFENAMKTLTSWIPVKDEDMLMKVTRAEWRSHQGSRRSR